MNLYDKMAKCLSSLSYNVSSMKVWFDGTITFRLGKYLGSAKLDVAHSEICVNLELDEENFAEYGVRISDVGLMYLSNELNTYIDALAFCVPFEVESQCLCVKKSFIYSSEEGAIKALIQAVSELSIAANAIMRIAAAFDFPNIPANFYQCIDNEMKSATFHHVVEKLPAIRILIVDDLFNPNLMSLKFFIRTLLPQSEIIEAEKYLDPVDMMACLMHQIQNNKIDIVVGYGNGCFFSHQLKDVPKVLIQPKFGFSDELGAHIEELNLDSVSLFPFVDTYRYFTLESCKRMESEQFMNSLQNEAAQSTTGFFWTDNTEENGDLFNKFYGPIQELSTKLGVIDADVVRYEIIPTISSLYAKTRRPKFMGDMG